MDNWQFGTGLLPGRVSFLSPKQCQSTEGKHRALSPSFLHPPPDQTPDVRGIAAFMPAL